MRVCACFCMFVSSWHCLLVCLYLLCICSVCISVFVPFFCVCLVYVTLYVYISCVYLCVCAGRICVSHLSDVSS